MAVIAGAVALLVVAIAGAAVVVPMLGSGPPPNGNQDVPDKDTPSEEAAANGAPSVAGTRVLLTPVILPPGQGGRTAPKPLQLILVVEENAAQRVCLLEPRIHDALILNVKVVNRHGLQEAIENALGAENRGLVLDLAILSEPPVFAAQTHGKDLGFDYRCSGGEARKG